jgi:carbon-monoxide dehydrogenase catalytic subunit
MPDEIPQTKEKKFLKQRLEKLPCQVGLHSHCCKHCLMGPCILTNSNDVGVCGANQDVIASRNLLRFTAAGASCHTGHALHLMEFLNKEFPNNYIEKKAPKYLIKLWKKLGLMPKVKFEHFKEISEALHASTLGTNADYQDILSKTVKLGIIDGYLGLYLATELEDKAFGKPKIRQGKINLGVIKPEKVNIAVHGHEPAFAEALAKEALKKENKDINLVGVCCTGASLLARHGIPLASNVVFQEEVIATGSIDSLVVDFQCILPSLVDLAECYKTTIITTNPIAKISGTTYLPVSTPNDAKRIAKQIIKISRDNFKKRNKDIKIEQKEVDAVIGFNENLAKELSIKLKNKEIKGIIAVIGCKNPRVKESWLPIFKKLSENYIILTSGCMAFEFGSAGMLDGKRIFHLGSCVNNSRIAEIFNRIAKLHKKKITDMPFIVSAPAPMTEKCVAIGFFFASLGVDVHFGYPMMITSDTNMEDFLRTVLKEHFESRIFLETDPEKFMEEIK